MFVRNGQLLDDSGLILGKNQLSIIRHGLMCTGEPDLTQNFKRNINSPYFFKICPLKVFPYSF